RRVNDAVTGAEMEVRFGNCLEHRKPQVRCHPQPLTFSFSLFLPPCFPSLPNPSSAVTHSRATNTTTTTTTTPDPLTLAESRIPLAITS
ncbi:unnamed protein product, partial [Sphenostylis stenocarpa]